MNIRASLLATGEPEVITRFRPSTSEKLIRWMRYDSLGRMVLNMDPHTSANFLPIDVGQSAGTGSTDLKAWRYVYDDAGDLVGTSDARGCGQNFHYDGAGRLTMEDYSPCEVPHANYSEPNTSTGINMEVAYHYDAVPTNKPNGFVLEASYDPTSPNLKGRLAAVFDRGYATLNTYDARGRITQLDRRLTKPNQIGGAQTVRADLYQDRWFRKLFTYDAADREVSTTTGATVTQLLGTGGQSDVTTAYSRRGTIKSVGGSYGTLVSRIERDADGLIEEIEYGDAAPTTTTNSYDERRRLSQAVTERGEASIWTPPPPANYLPAPLPGGSLPTFQFTLQDNEYVYDVVGNPIEIRDLRTPAEWPAGAKPVSRQAQYDDLYRVRQVDYTYHPNGTDTWTSPFAPEAGGLPDPRRGTPAPIVPFTNRMLQQTYEYDWLGSISKSNDDLNAFWDRSVGTVVPDTAAGQPYQFTLASHPNNDRANNVTYDAAGNLLRHWVFRSALACPQCAIKFEYYYDEIGQILRARRLEGTPGTETGVADMRYTYDASGQRTRKNSVVNQVGAQTFFVFDTLEIRRGLYTNFDVALNADTEVPYLISNGIRLGRVVLEQANDGEPRINYPTDPNARQHVFLNIGDHLGSTTAIVDKQTSELVELGTYQAYGATESDYRPDRWKGFREDYRFTGKEDDIEVGLTYFGKRFYSPHLGRWVSPDPLAVHVPGRADLNLYAYVSGEVLKATDPIGLEPVKKQAGTVADLRKLLDTSPNKVGLKTGAAAATKLKQFGETHFDWKRFRPMPSDNWMNLQSARYVYTKSEGWVDMSHFLFYAGRSFQMKEENLASEARWNSILFRGPLTAAQRRKAADDAVAGAVQEGRAQEFTDRRFAPHSAYSYEDLPSDRLGAEFGARYFDPTSKKTFGEQIEDFLKSRGADAPTAAPNYGSLPLDDAAVRAAGKPSATNHGTSPMYTTPSPAPATAPSPAPSPGGQKK